MIPKFICWVFGHKIWTEVFTGRTADIHSNLAGGTVTVPVVRKVRNEVCPRCDRKIPQ